MITRTQKRAQHPGFVENLPSSSVPVCMPQCKHKSLWWHYSDLSQETIVRISNTVRGPVVHPKFSAVVAQLIEAEQVRRVRSPGALDHASARGEVLHGPFLLIVCGFRAALVPLHTHQFTGRSCMRGFTVIMSLKGTFFMLLFGVASTWPSVISRVRARCSRLVRTHKLSTCSTT